MPGTRNHNKSLYVEEMYKSAFMGYKMLDTKYDKVFMVDNSAKGAGIKETQLLELEELDRHTAEGQDISFEFPSQGWVYYGKYFTFSKGLSLSYEANEDAAQAKNIKDVLKKFAQRLGRAAQHTKETFASRVFNNGGALLGDYVFNGSFTDNADPSGNLLYDSKPLFNLTGNTRSTKGGGTYFNSTAGLTLTYSNFKTTYNLHRSTNNRGELDRPIPNPADTILVTPGRDEASAEEILMSRNKPDTDVNNVNAHYKKLSQIITWDYLTDSAYYIGKAKHESFQFHQRQAPLIRYFVDHNNAGSKAYYIERFGVWIKDWRCWTRGGGSSS